MKYIVYQTTNKINGKLYIGVHKTLNPNVFDGYIGNGIKIGYSLQNPKTVYQNALKKYGYDNFVRTTLFVYDTLEEAYTKEGEIVNSEFVKLDNNYNTAIGGLSTPLIYKSVFQFNKQKELVNEWKEGQLEICEYLGISHNKINYTILNKKILQDCYWSYENNPDFSEYSNYKNYNLYQFDFEGNLLNIYKSTKDCCKKTGYSFTSIQDATSHKRKYKDCFWTHDPDNIFNIIKMVKLFNLNYKPVNVFDENNNLIREYIDINSASKEECIDKQLLNSLIKSGNVYKGLFYSYSNTLNKNMKVGQYNKDTNELIKIWNSVSDCAKIHPKCREVLKGQRNQTHGYTFKFI